jgi:copper transport protein
MRSSFSRTALWRRGALWLTIIVVACGIATSARAHAVLLDAQPADRAILADAPREVRFCFNEVVAPTVVQILDAGGKPVAGAGPFSAQDATVTLPLPALSPGTYVVSYRVTSADSHPVGGTIVFGVGVISLAADAAAVAAGSADAQWAVIWALVRALFDAAILLATGGVFFRYFVLKHRASPRGDIATIRIAAIVAIVTGVLQLGVRGAQLLGAPLAGIGHAALWRTAIETSLGPSIGVAVAALCIVLLGAALRRESIAAKASQLAGSVLALAAFGLTGHAATADPIWLTAPVLVLHTACVAYWLGSLPPLYRRLGKDSPEDTAAVVTRFSTIALILVAVLILCGLVLAMVQLLKPVALVNTDYGMRLLIKLAFVASLLFLAALNKRLFTPRLSHADAQAALWLRRSIVAELALMAGVILVTATLGQVVPPREIVALDSEGGASPGFSGMAMNGEAMADIAVAPARAGANRVVLELSGGNGAPITAEEVTVWLANPELGIEPIAQKAVKQGDGEYVLSSMLFPVAGTWTLSIEALISDFEQTNFTTSVLIK